MERVIMIPLYRLYGPMFVVLFLLSFCTRGEALMCYECNDALTNEECNTPENLVDCDNIGKSQSASHDTCRTKVFKIPGEEVRYTKGCVVGPCSLDGNQDVALGMADCDRSSPSWECQYCCQHDKCNANGAISTHAMTVVAWYVSIVLVSRIL